MMIIMVISSIIYETWMSTSPLLMLYDPKEKFQSTDVSPSSFPIKRTDDTMLSI